MIESTRAWKKSPTVDLSVVALLGSSVSRSALGVPGKCVARMGRPGTLLILSRWLNGTEFQLPKLRAAGSNPARDTPSWLNGQSVRLRTGRVQVRPLPKARREFWETREVVTLSPTG